MRIERIAGTRIFGRRGVVSLILVLVLGVAGCAGGDGDSAASSGDSAADGSSEQRAAVPAPREVVEAEVGEAAGGSGGGGSVAGGGSTGAYASADSVAGTTASSQTTGGRAPKLPDVGPSVIKTATLRVGVRDDELEATLNDAVAIAGRYGGFVLSSQLGRRDSGGTLTMRIPAPRFEAALGDLEGLGKVRSETISGEDVGQEFVDLQARLRNWESQEAVLLKLMGRAESVVDTIRVQSELSRVQLEIEQLRGRLNFLRDQTALGTITATFAPLSAPAPSTPSRFAQAWTRAVDLMQSFVAGIIVTSGVLIPLTLIALLLLVAYRALKPRLTH